MGVYPLSGRRRVGRLPALKAEEKEYIAAGTYTEEVQVDLATRYGKLMGYSDEHIAESIGA